MSFIRAGREDDIAEILAIQAASPEAAQWNPRDYLQYDVRVSIEDGHVAGFLVCRATSADEFELLNLAVAPEFRRRGAGRRMVKTLLESFQTTPIFCVFLEVRESNYAAREFYKNLGFQQVSIRPNYYDFPLETAIVMKFQSC
jgi:ribosomal-protein-alanine N-acetyltransferase